MKKIPRYEQSALGILYDMNKNGFVNFQEKAVARYGDICNCKIFSTNLILVSKKEYIKHILYDNRLNYAKLKRFNIFQQVFGKYSLIFTNNYEQWKKDKAIIMPAFMEKNFDHYGEVFTRNCTEMLNLWDDYARKNLPINVNDMMSILTLKNLLHALFGNLEVDIPHFLSTLRSLMAGVEDNLKSFTGLKYKLPTPSNIKYRKLLHEFHNLILQCIETKKKDKNEEVNLLAVLINALENEPDQKETLIRIRDELFTFLTAGFDTTAATLEWTWITLSQQPTIKRLLREELTRVIGDRKPTYKDLVNLPYLYKFTLEILRVRPPVCSLLRTVVADDEIDGFHIPANATLSIPVSAVQRRSIYWENPEGFDPDRFDSIDLADEYLYTYLPFGAGPRICIGKNFAIVQTSLTIATILQKYDLNLPFKQDLQQLDTGFVLHPGRNLQMCLKKID